MYGAAGCSSVFVSFALCVCVSPPTPFLAPTLFRTRTAGYVESIERQTGVGRQKPV